MYFLMVGTSLNLWWYAFNLGKSSRQPGFMSKCWSSVSHIIKSEAIFFTVSTMLWKSQAKTQYAASLTRPRYVLAGQPRVVPKEGFVRLKLFAYVFNVVRSRHFEIWAVTDVSVGFAKVGDLLRNLITSKSRMTEMSWWSLPSPRRHLGLLRSRSLVQRLTTCPSLCLSFPWDHAFLLCVSRSRCSGWASHHRPHNTAD